MQAPKKPRCVRKILAGPKSLEDELKELRASKAEYAKKCAKLTNDQRKLLAKIKAEKEVGSFMMPDSPDTKKRKGKGRSDSRKWLPCPLLPGVPAVPPLRKPQPWEVQRSHETLTDPKLPEQSPCTFVSAPATERTVQEVSDNDIIEVPPSEIQNFFSPPSGVIQVLDPDVIPVMTDIEIIDLAPSSCTSITAPESGTSTTFDEMDLDVDTPVEVSAGLFECSKQHSLIERTLNDSVDDIVGITPPDLQNKRKRKILFYQSSGNIEFLEPDINPSPQGRTEPESGTSIMSDEIDGNIEHQPPEEDSDNEVEVEEDLSLHRRTLLDYTQECDALDEVIAVQLAKEIHRIDAEADVVLRDIVDNGGGGLLNFDWSSDLNNFEGVRENFAGPSGPTFQVTGLTPLEVLKKIWDDDLIDHIVLMTNRYAHQIRLKATKINSRMSRWRDTDREEIWRFLTIIMIQSFVVSNVEREYWYPHNEQMRIGSFDEIMTFNRFVLLKRCLHFVDNTSLPKNPSTLDKVMPILKHLNKKFSTLYLPDQNVSIDESLLLWKGRLSFTQMIARKRARVGIKSYELCESRTGYLWRMKVYSGKGEVYEPQKAPQKAVNECEMENKPKSATAQIVYNLMRPLFGKGHTIIMDNFYNAPLLSRHLKTVHKTDTIGTLRLNREFVPESLKYKTKLNMRTGEVVFSTTKDLSVVVWKDNNNVVPLISTYHRPEVGGKEKYGYYKYKPSVVLDYNLAMGGVDYKDQMLQGYPIERTRNCCWYKKLFRRLLNVSIHNSLVIFNHNRSKSSRIRNREFRHQLIRDMQQMYSPLSLNKKVSAPTSAPAPIPTALSQLHFPAKNEKRQRCKMCYLANLDRKTMWRCSTCNTNLCIEGCYTVYHANHVFK